MATLVTTVVAIALDVEGAEAAAKYYKRSGITFPALTDPNYATRFRAVALTPLQTRQKSRMEDT